MNKPLVQVIDEAISAWDMYCSGDYNDIVSEYQYSDNDDLQDIALLARIEIDHNSPVLIQDRSLFSPLVSGMIAYHGGDHVLASSILGNWLLNKNFYSDSIIERFIYSVGQCNNLPLTYKVTKKFQDHERYSALIARPLFNAAFGLEKFTEALSIYRNNKEILNQISDLQKLGFILLQLERYKESEKLLLDVYERYTGKKYEINYDEVKKRYSDIYMKRIEMEKSKELSFDEKWSLGMAYLFFEEYDKALKILKGLKVD